MNRLEAHQSDPKSNLFGLLASRFLFIGQPHETPHDEVSGRQADVAQKTKELQEDFLGRVAKYNGHWGDQVKKESRDELRYVYETLKFDMKNLDATKAQLNRIWQKLADLYGPAFQQQLIGDGITKPNDQYVSIQGLIGTIDELKKLPAKGAEAVESGHRTRFSRRHEMMMQSRDSRAVWEKKPAYAEVISIFETVAKEKEFKEMWQSPDGMMTQNQREARELFLAMMAEKTNNFEDTFVLGPDFQDDYEENIKNYPFLYNEFLKLEGDKVAGDAVSEEAVLAAESGARLAASRLVGKDDAPAIIGRNTAAGITPNQLPPLPSVPSSENWNDRLHILKGMVHKLREKAAQAKETPTEPGAGGFLAAANDLELHVAHAEAYLALSRLKEREGGVREKFTRAELSKPNRRKTVITLAMRKFMKAQEMVDYPKGNANWKHLLHPTVRRMLIASTYESGVGHYETRPDGTVVYNDSNESQQAWMLSTLVLSDYFNFKEKGEDMDADHTAVLKAVYLGGHIAVLLEHSREIYDPNEQVDGLLEAWVKVLQDSKDASKIPTDSEKREAYFLERMGPWPPEYVKKYAKYTLEEAQTALATVKNDGANLQKFLDETKKAVKNPYAPESQKFIADMKSGQYKGRLASSIESIGQLGIFDGATLAAYESQMNSLQINFKTAELEEKNMLQFFEGLGMNIEGIYPAYLSQIKKNPKLKAEYWDDMLLGSDTEFDQLINLLTIIIPPNAAGGKEDFIQGLKSLRKKYKGEKSLIPVLAGLKEGDEDAAIINVFQMLRSHLSGRAEKAATSDRAAKEVEAKLNGVHVGDKASEIVGGVWTMLTGPGQSIANRAAGLILMYGFYKSARMAMKGEGRMGQAMRALFVAGAIEIATKNITGRGILDRIGLDAISGAMGGKTYEAVLLQDAEKNMDMKDITPEAHAAALYELNDVPFDKVMAWYESSDDNGMPQNKGDKDLFPNQIQLGKIAPKITWEAKDKKREARRVVRETVKHFFRFVGDKDNKRGMEHGKESLKERWIKKVNDPNYVMKYSTYDHSEWIQAGGVKKSDINWSMVMRAEIDLSQVDLTAQQTPLGKLEATATEWYEELSKWTQEHVWNPGSGYAQEFFEDMGEHAQDAKKFLENFCDGAERKIYFGKEKVILWYGEHQYEIKRVAKDHWDLLVTGVKLPFKVVAAVDNFAIPWTLATLEKIELSLANRQTVHIDHDLSEKEIVSSWDNRKSTDLKLNPEYSYFGEYQEDFLGAYEAGKTGEMFYENPETHVGYYISKMTPQEAGVDKNDPIFSGNPANAEHKMMEKSREKAIEYYYKQGIDKELVKKHLYAIHKVVKTTDPKMIYVFWRMPMNNSLELRLLENGEFADYRDPNKRKDREFFQVDPSQTSWENIQRGLLQGTDSTRTFVAKSGVYAAQIPRVIFAHWEVLGKAVGKIGNALGGGPEFQDAVVEATKADESTRIFIDEAFTSARSPHAALSEFYGDKKSPNAKLYDFSLKYAQKKKKQLHLGLLEGRKGYEGRVYLLGQLDYEDMKRYYEGDYAKQQNGKKDKDIKKAIDDKLNEAAKP